MAIKICLDAGHYGKYNQSPVVPEYYESDMNWKLHLKLKAELENCGFTVVTTRACKDKDLPLFDRGMASKGCDLLLSLHSNAASTEPVDYITILHQVNDSRTDIDNIGASLAEKLAPVITEVMGVTQRTPRIDGVLSSTDRDGDGIKNDNHYGILHGARMAETPALIIEHSFHTNRRAAKWLLAECNLDKLAKAEAQVIAAFFGCGKSGEKQKPPCKPVRYRAQVGAYTLENNAKNMVGKLQRAGFEGCILKEDAYYKVLSGGFYEKADAAVHVDLLKSKGFSAFVKAVN